MTLDIKSLLPSLDVFSEDIVKVLVEDKKNALVAQKPGTDTLVFALDRFPGLQLKVPVTVHEPENIAKVYITVKREDENILPFQKLEVPMFSLKPFIENADDGEPAYNQPTVAHAISMALQKSGSGYIFRADEKAQGKVYLYSVEKDGLYSYGWGGEPSPAAFAKAWIVQTNGVSYLNDFDQIPIKSGDTLILYHVSDLLSPWQLSTLFSSNDTIALGYDVEITALGKTCQYSGGLISESSFIPSVNKEVSIKSRSLQETGYTNDNGKVVFTMNEAFDTRVTSGNDALVIYVDMDMGIEGVEKHDVSLYPNPAGDILKLNMAGEFVKRLEFYSSQGILMKKLLEPHADKDIDIKGFPRGVYLVKIVTPKGVYACKLIKK